MSKQLEILTDGKRCFVFPQIIRPRDVNFVEAFPMAKAKNTLSFMNKLRQELSLRLLKANEILLISSRRNHADVMCSLRERIKELEQPLFKYWFMIRSLRESLEVNGTEEVNGDDLVFRWKTCFILPSKRAKAKNAKTLSEKLASYYGYNEINKSDEESESESDSEGQWSWRDVFSSVMSYAPSVRREEKTDTGSNLFKEMALREKRLREHKHDRFAEWRFTVDNKNKELVERGAFADRNIAYEELMVSICAALFFLHRSDLRFHMAMNNYIDHLQYGEKVNVNKTCGKINDDFTTNFKLEEGLIKDVQQSQKDSIYAMHILNYTRKVRKQWTSADTVKRFVPFETTFDGAMLLKRIPPVYFQRGFILRVVYNLKPIEDIIEGKPLSPKYKSYTTMAGTMVNMSEHMKKEFLHARAMSNVRIQHDGTFMNQSIKFETLAYIMRAEALCVSSIHKNGPFLGMALLKHCRRKLNELSSRNTPRKKLVNELIEQMKIDYYESITGEVDESVLEKWIPRKMLQVEKLFLDAMEKESIHESLKKLSLCDTLPEEESPFVLQMVDRVKRNAFFDVDMRPGKVIFMSL